MLVKIKCPDCESEGTISLAVSTYEGPYRCWKCKGLYSIKMHNNELMSCEPLTQEEFEKQQEIDALKKKISGE
jgi:hypothetical protein